MALIILNYLKSGAGVTLDPIIQPSSIWLVFPIGNMFFIRVNLNRALVKENGTIPF